MPDAPTFPSNMLINRMKKGKNYVYTLLCTKRGMFINKNDSRENVYMNVDCTHSNVFRKSCSVLPKRYTDCGRFFPPHSHHLDPKHCELTPELHRWPNSLSSTPSPLSVFYLISTPSDPLKL